MSFGSAGGSWHSGSLGKLFPGVGGSGSGEAFLGPLE